MSAITDLAKGQDCTIRLPGCRNETDTVVAAHFRMAGISGTGIKPPDTCVAWACSDCHSIVDGRVKYPMPWNEIRQAHLEGVMRTLHKIDRMGYKLRMTK